MARYVDAHLAPIYLNTVACEQIKRMPTADVEEVVRCKNCIHYDDVGECEVHPYDGRFNVNYFCADGERKMSNEED